MRTSHRAQSLLEYCILGVVILLGLISMQAYMKRGIQGRWKESVDQLGEQYDPSMRGSTTHTLTTDATTNVFVNATTTVRRDSEDSTEKKTVSMSGSL